MFRNQRADDPKHPSPEACQSTCGAPNGSWEALRRPTIEHGVEHTLEEIFHDVEADVGSFAVNGAKNEHGDSHEGGGDNHSPLATEAGQVVAEDAKKDANDAGKVDVDVGSVGKFKSEVDGTVFESEDTGKEGACDETSE